MKKACLMTPAPVCGPPVLGLVVPTAASSGLEQIHCLHNTPVQTVHAG